MPGKTVKLTLRVTQEGAREIAEGARARGYGSPTAFLRAAVRNELSARADLSDSEQRIVASFARVYSDVFRVGRGQQALFALLDSLAKTLLTCIPEPPMEVRRQAIALARERYDALIKTAGRAMDGDARAALRDLLDKGLGAEDEARP